MCSGLGRGENDVCGGPQGDVCNIINLKWNKTDVV